jgi:multisubunit Na+/H+ antiporter MnhC subunit
MNFGQNFLDWLSSNAQPLVLAAFVVMGLYLIYKREITKLIGFVILAIIVAVMVFNPSGFKDVMLSIGNKVFGAATGK